MGRAGRAEKVRAPIIIGGCNLLNGGGGCRAGWAGRAGRARRARRRKGCGHL